MNDIESELTFKIEDRTDDPSVFLAAGTHSFGDRSVEYVYVRERTDEGYELRVQSRYRLLGDVVASETERIQEQPDPNGEIREFIHEDFYADPEGSVGQEWEQAATEQNQ